jgi:hypothetical protein
MPTAIDTVIKPKTFISTAAPTKLFGNTSYNHSKRLITNDKMNPFTNLTLNKSNNASNGVLAFAIGSTGNDGAGVGFVTGDPIILYITNTKQNKMSNKIYN